MSSLSSVFSTAISGLDASQTTINVTSNNVANADTVGFKASNALFATQFAQTLTPVRRPRGFPAASAAAPTRPRSVWASRWRPFKPTLRKVRSRPLRILQTWQSRATDFSACSNPAIPRRPAAPPTSPLARRFIPATGSFSLTARISSPPAAANCCWVTASTATLSCRIAEPPLRSRFPWEKRHWPRPRAASRCKGHCPPADRWPRPLRFRPRQFWATVRTRCPLRARPPWPRTFPR